MSIGTNTLKTYVIKEVNKLRELLTDDQKKLLKWKKIKPYDNKKCIYGRLCGVSYNEKAYELKKEVCTIFLYYCGGLERYITKSNSNVCSFSPLEHYLMNNPEKIREVVRFIKGKTDTLNLQGE